MEEDDRGIYGRVVEVIDALDRRRYPYSFTLDTTGVQAAMVSFDGRTLFTDSSGLVAFGELEPGPLSVQVSKPDYLALDTTLTLVPGADFLFFLAPPLVDYFPLQVGNRYTYAFRIFLEIGMSFRWSGKEEWEISGMTMTETDTVYAVQVRRWKVPSTSSDTVITDTAYTIHQAGNRIAMSVPRMSWDHVLCRRYYPDSSPEIVSVLTRGDIASYWDMSMMRGVGPRSWRAHGGFASNHWDYSWSLTDWAFPGRTARQK
jgi:hypothetical protein